MVLRVILATTQDSRNSYNRFRTGCYFMTEAVAPTLDTRLGVPETRGSSVQAGDVVRHLTHELRQPLSAIESIAYYLGMVLPEEKKITSQLGRLRHLVEQMNWSLTDAVHLLQAAPVSPQVLDLHELITAVLAERAAQPGPIFHPEFSEAPALVNMDAAQAAHLVRGVMLTMSQLPEAANIMVRTAVEEARVRFDIQVPGFELGPEELDRFFSPLDTHLLNGALSLACARKIAEGHGGTLEAASIPRVGVRFRCSFPLAG